MVCCSKILFFKTIPYVLPQESHQMQQILTFLHHQDHIETKKFTQYKLLHTNLFHIKEKKKEL